MDLLREQEMRMQRAEQKPMSPQKEKLDFLIGLALETAMAAWEVKA